MCIMHSWDIKHAVIKERDWHCIMVKPVNLRQVTWLAWTSGSSSVKWDDTSSSKHQCLSCIPQHTWFQHSQQHLLQISGTFSQPNHSQPTSSQDFMAPGVIFTQVVVPLFLAPCVGHFWYVFFTFSQSSHVWMSPFPTTATCLIRFPLFTAFSSLLFSPLPYC